MRFLGLLLLFPFAPMRGSPPRDWSRQLASAGSRAAQIVTTRCVLDLHPSTSATPLAARLVPVALRRHVARVKSEELRVRSLCLHSPFTTASLKQLRRLCFGP